jgi:hypothetical protein
MVSRELDCFITVTVAGAHSPVLHRVGHCNDEQLDELGEIGVGHDCNEPANWNQLHELKNKQSLERPVSLARKSRIYKTHTY